MSTPCEHCPFTGTGTTCPRWPSNHSRFCEWVDPAGPAFKPRGAEALRAIAARRGQAPPPAPSPSIARRAANLAGAVASAVASGGEKASPAEQARRLEICGGCEFFKPENRTCLKCGCYTNLKARLQAWHCPIEKW